MKWNWNRVWWELAYNLLLRGFIPVHGVKYWARKDKVPLRLLREVAAALGVEEFESDGTQFWRLSGKVVPILPRQVRGSASRQAGGAA
jgi:hypothetical protein